MKTAVMLFTRDLRLRDNPALAAACDSAEHVVPLYVLDPELGKLSANRNRFLAECLADLRAELRERGADLIVRQGDPVAETVKVARELGAEGVAAAGDVSRYARRRERRLRDACEQHRISLRVFPGVTIVNPGDVRPVGSDHYRVFTPYFRAWSAATWRDQYAMPRRIVLPRGAKKLDTGLPEESAGESPGAAAGGETEARRALRRWFTQLDRYDDRHDDLAAGGTSRLSPYLRFGCLSPLTVAAAARDRGGAGGAAFVRQLCWRDFYYQVTLSFPDLATRRYRPGAREDWRYDGDALAAWQEGRTGVPIVDAGMRQLRAEGWMHNRARLITGAFLTRHLRLDWRDGGRWFYRWLLDGDVANNFGNWQWVAGTGNDSRPYRRFNPIRQATRFDPDGAYVRRYVPELASVNGGAVHQPWRLPEAQRKKLDYPPPLESHGDEAVWLRD